MSYVFNEQAPEEASEYSLSADGWSHQLGPHFVLGESAKKRTNGHAMNGHATNGQAQMKASNELPEDSPHAKRLKKTGVTTFADLEAYEDLADIKGIGDSYTLDIAQAL